MFATAAVSTLPLALGAVEVLGPDDSEVTPTTTEPELVGVVLSVEGAAVVGVDAADASPHVTLSLRRVVGSVQGPRRIDFDRGRSPRITSVSAEMSMSVDAVVESTTTSRDVDPNPATSTVTCTDTPFGGKPDQSIDTRSQVAAAPSTECAEDGDANAEHEERYRESGEESGE